MTDDRQQPPSFDPAWDSARRQVGNEILSIIMPAYALGHSIADNVRKVYALFANQLPFEIVVVDDGSKDNTRQELEKITALAPKVRVVHLARNMGKGAALKSGFETSCGNYVLLLDADLDFPPHQVSTFFDIMEQERADVVIGSKRHPDSIVDSYPWHRWLASCVYYTLIKLLVGLPIKDTQSGIKLFKREALEYAIPRTLVKQFAFDLELLAIIHGKGFHVAEAPIILRSGATWGWLRPATVRQVLHDTIAIFYRFHLLHYYQTIRDTRMPEPPPLVSIIVTYPAPTQYMEDCLEGILKQTYWNYEVILLPDGHSGRSWPEKIREIPTGRLRPAEKRNIGIEQARGDIAAFIDDDAFPTENWLQQAIVYFSDAKNAAVGGPATTPGNDPYLAQLSGRVYANPLVSGEYCYRYVPDHVREVEDFPSCNLFVRTEILRKLGGFRTDFWPGEDTYLCLEIVRKLEQKIIYDPRVHVYHHRRKLFLPHLRQIGRYALHRGYFARRFPATSRKLSYMLPSLFVLGLILSGVFSVMSLFCRLVYFRVLFIYAITTLLSCFQWNPATWLLTWLGIILTHIVYGVRFLAGLLSKRLPDEVQSFDHPSEEDVV